MSETLTASQAYLAMFAFLESQFRRNRSEELAALLGSLSLLPDGRPVDTAVSSEWRAAVEAARSGKVRANLEVSRES